MAKKPTVTTISSGFASNTQLNTNFTAIRDAFDNTLSLDGSTPNAMQADLDLNGNALLNVGTIDADNLTLNGQTVVDITSIPEWRGAWSTGVSYAKNDLVKQSGSAYICLVAHTSGTFSTDLTALKWELFAEKGAAGAGTGDMVGANNLSDVADVATARANLGLGTVATENTVPVAKGGTGAPDAATARTNLGVQAADATLTSLSGLSLVSGDILYATAADTLARLAIGTANQILRVNAGATAAEWFTPNNSFTWLASQATTSGTSVDVTGIPASATEVVVSLEGNSLSGSANILIQMGHSGGIISTGYLGYSDTVSSTAGFPVIMAGAARVLYGRWHFNKPSGNLWIGALTGARVGISGVSGGGQVNLSANVLDRIRITSDGADTLDAGAIRVGYR